MIIAFIALITAIITTAHTLYVRRRNAELYARCVELEWENADLKAERAAVIAGMAEIEMEAE